MGVYLEGADDKKEGACRFMGVCLGRGQLGAAKIQLFSYIVKEDYLYI